MTFSPFKSSVLSFAVAAVFVAGCDDLSATNKATVRKVEAAVGQLASLPTLAPGEGVDTVTTALTNAADSAGSGPYKAVAGGAAAAVDQQAAYAAILKLKDQGAKVRRTLLDLRRLAQQVYTSSAYASGYTQGNPAVAIEKLSGHISAMQGNAQNTTWGTPNTQTLPTLAAVKQESARLEGEIEQKQQQLNDLTKKRTDSLATAEVQTNHANSLKREEAVRAFADASETRRAAEDLTITMDLLQVQIDRLKSDLALIQGQNGVVDTGVQSLKEQGKLLETDWGTQQKFAANQKAIAAAAVEGDDNTKQSIKTTAAELKTQLEDLATARSAVLEQLNEANKYAQLASGEATKFSQTLTDKFALPGKEGATYKSLRDVVHPQLYQYRIGTVQRDLGAVSLSEAGLLRDVKAAIDEAKAAIDAAGLTAPAELSAVDAAAGDQLLKDADNFLTESSTSLSNVESGDAPETLKSAAKTARLITLFNHMELFAQATAAGDTSAAAKATQAASDAEALKAELVAANVALPPLPGPLGNATPTTTPATPAE